MIRAARKSEAILLSELAIESKAFWGYSAKFLEKCRNELTISTEEISSPTHIFNVYEKNGIVVGFYGLSMAEQHKAELESLFVIPANIGQGIGKTLVLHAIDYLKGNKFQSLKIQGDPNAKGFYLACGAKEVGEQPSASIDNRKLPVFEINLIS